MTGIKGVTDEMAARELRALIKDMTERGVTRIGRLTLSKARADLAVIEARIKSDTGRKVVHGRWTSRGPNAQDVPRASRIKSDTGITRDTSGGQVMDKSKDRAKSPPVEVGDKVVLRVGSDRYACTVVAVNGAGRRLEVEDESGAVTVFRWNAERGRFTQVGSPHRALTLGAGETKLDPSF